MSKKNVILVDGYNTMFRVAWAFKDMTNKGEPVGVLFGYFKILSSLFEKWDNANIAICWESKSKRRIAESKEAIELGIISSEYGFYKENRQRKKEEMREAEKDLYDSIEIQKETLFELLSYTSIQQIKVDGFEADDIIGTICENYRDDENADVFVISSDKDFYQLISDNVSIYDPIKHVMWDFERFCSEYEMLPYQWVDCGALTGDKGDNICGVKGIGIKNATAMINKYENVDNLIKELSKIKETKERKMTKREENVVNSIDKLKLSYSLKRIDKDVPDVPKEITRNKDSNKEMLEKRFKDLSFNSLMKNIDMFC